MIEGQGPTQAWIGSFGLAIRGLFWLARYHHRKSNRKNRPLAFGTVARFYGSPMDLHQMTDNRQPQSQPAVFSRGCAIGLSKTIKNIGDKLFFNSRPGVTHSNG